MKILTVILMLISGVTYNQKVNSEEVKKIIFEIDSDIYTSIDIENRKKYLILKGDSINENSELFIKEYIGILLYSYEYENLTNNNINELTNDFYYEFFSNNENIKKNSMLKKIYNKLGENEIKNNIKQDLKRKLILENYLEKKINEIFNLEDDELLNIYNIFIEYYIFDKKIKKDLLKISEAIDYENINKNIDKIIEKNIDYYYDKKQVKNIEKIDKKIAKFIKENKKLFFIEQIENIIVGKISKEIKYENSITYQLIQISESNIKNENELNCDNIKKNISLNSNIKIKELNAKYSKLNNNIKENLKKIDDYIIILKDSKKSYLILCNIDYDQNSLKELSTKQKIDEMIFDFDKKFYKNKTKEFNLIMN